jgi:hypothetical protein
MLALPKEYLDILLMRTFKIFEYINSSTAMNSNIHSYQSVESLSDPFVPANF